MQDYLLSILYILLIAVHSFTLCRKDFHRSLISIFSFALVIQTVSTIMFTAHHIVVSHSEQLSQVTSIDLSPLYNVHYFAQLMHTISINFFILFLLIVAKGWPITRRDMPFKYAFATFWLICLIAELVTFYWTAITLLTKNFTSDSSAQGGNSTQFDVNNSTIASTPSSTNTTSSILTGDTQFNSNLTTLSNFTYSTLNPLIAINQNLPNDSEQFNSTPRRLSLLIRLIVMSYFLLQLRTTMILEQEQKKLQFYLHFGALSMVWFVHSLIVYVISLRVELVWQSKLITGFSSAADFLAFAITTRLLWHKGSRAYLFSKNKRRPVEDLDDEHPFK